MTENFHHNENLMSWLDHTHIFIKGDCYTPPRGWYVTLYKESEIQTVGPAIQKYIRPITTSDRFLLEMHFPINN